MSRLNYKHLRYFWAVAKTGSISKAAAQLHLTPQSISGQLTEFSGSLGVDLFRKSGRNLELTDAGRKVLSYADEIFSIGDEMMENIKNQSSQKMATLRIGIADSVSKTIAYHLLKPAYEGDEAVRLFCREGRLLALLSDLSIHRLDLIIADRAMPPHLHIKGFNHLVAETSMALYGTPKIIKNLKGSFPAALNNAPLLMIGEDAAIRSKLNRWMVEHDVYPNIKGEFDDSALMKSFGQAGVGLFFAPAVIHEKICRQYQVDLWEKIDSVCEQFYVITTQRKLTHPIIKAICGSFEKNETLMTRNLDLSG